MPLREGSSDEVISHNIEELIRAGHKRDQAVAIAYGRAGRARSDMHKAIGIAPPDAPKIEKIERSAFLFMKARGKNKGRFAQCITCIHFLIDQDRCYLQRDRDDVDDDDSCGGYYPGEPTKGTDLKPLGNSTPEELGFVEREVRCQNCMFFDPDSEALTHCDLYTQLNRMFPALFKLDRYVEKLDCCNAQTPGERNPAVFGPIGPLMEDSEMAKSAVMLFVKSAVIEEPDTAVRIAREQLEQETQSSNNAILFANSSQVNAAGENDSQGRTDPNPTVAQKVSGEYAKRVVGWQGLNISIENEAGSYREGVNRDGQKWRQRMPYPYGYINDTTGIDLDHVDVFVGPHLDDAQFVYIVHARKVNRWDEYDEDKVMVGFRTEQEAVQAFLDSYTDPRFLGPVTEMIVGEFVDKVRNTKDRPTMIKALFIARGKSRD